MASFCASGISAARIASTVSGPLHYVHFSGEVGGHFWFAFFSRRMNLKEAMIYDSMKHKFISLELIEIKAKALYTFISISSK
jgi:hypothetical protein